jgi:HEPN domain-containing protein
MSDNWRPWWDEAEHQSVVARELFDAGHFSSAIFHALMARELAIKALRSAPATYDDLEHATWDELEAFTYDDIGEGVGRGKGHNPALDAPWQRGYDGAASARQINEVEHQLGLAAGSLYEACRYPDRWPAGATAPHQQLTSAHAQQVLAAVELVLEPCRPHFGGLRQNLER